MSSEAVPYQSWTSTKRSKLIKKLHFVRSIIQCIHVKEVYGKCLIAT